MNNEFERELGWDDTIIKEGEEFPLIPEGDYEFIVEKFERSRFNGSAKMPPCNQAKLTIKVFNSQVETHIIHTLLLHTKTEWALSQFFTSIGQKRKGEPLRMDWNRVFGASGKCEVIVNEYTDKNGVKRKNNRIYKFLEPTAAQPMMGQYTAGAF